MYKHHLKDMFLRVKLYRTVSVVNSGVSGEIEREREREREGERGEVREEKQKEDR